MSDPAPSFVLTKTRVLPAPISEVAAAVLSTSEESIKRITTSSSIVRASGDSFKYISSVPTHIPDTDKFGYNAPSQSKSNTNRFVPADDTHGENGVTINFTFVETISMLPFGLLAARPLVTASWTFLGNEASERRVGVYHSSVDERGVKVQKIRRLKEVEGGTEVEEVCAVWCPWGVGAFSSRVADKSLNEMMQSFADMFPQK
ncbi:hypothetical protein EDC01DRAFT_655912 [Geopyxis carbonaria]|nr:hypothetical protein EDC01DRAFT_655912 [Geopyxis carbonaria]